MSAGNAALLARAVLMTTDRDERDVLKWEIIGRDYVWGGGGVTGLFLVFVVVSFACTKFLLYVSRLSVYGEHYEYLIALFRLYIPPR